MARLLVVLALAGGVAIWLYLDRRARGAGRDRLARARAAFLHAPAEASAGGTEGSREAGDGGGHVRFRVPSHFREQHAPDGSVSFADPASGERSLRLSVLSLERRGRARAEELAFDLGSLRPRSESALETLADGRLLLAVPSESAHDILTVDDVRRVERAVRAATIA
jgi:hypothetical protein